jgi:hypothetical protein
VATLEDAESSIRDCKTCAAFLFTFFLTFHILTVRSLVD